MSTRPESEPTLMHRDDGTACTSTVRNEAGTLRCTEHGRAVWGSGWFPEYFDQLEQQVPPCGCLCHNVSQFSSCGCCD